MDHLLFLKVRVLFDLLVSSIRLKPKRRMSQNDNEVSPLHMCWALLNERGKKR